MPRAKSVVTALTVVLLATGIGALQRTEGAAPRPRPPTTHCPRGRWDCPTTGVWPGSGSMPVSTSPGTANGRRGRPRARCGRSPDPCGPHGR